MPPLVVLLLLSLVGAVAARPQGEALATTRATTPATARAERTTADGIYTAAQARLGATVFEEACQNCHVSGWERMVGFYGKWHGKPLSHLMTYLRREMPQTDPGSLTSDEYGQVTAYLLRLSGMPAGAETLNPDPDALVEIRIDTIPSIPR